MKKKTGACLRKIAALALAASLALAVGLIASPALAEDLQSYAASVRGNGSPYLICVNTKEHVVTVYGLGEDGRYSVPVRSMICSTGKAGSGTPLGTFSIYGLRYEWRLMVDGSYGQYATRFNGSILFHSVCFSKAEPSALLSYEYDMLGAPASLGCVRLQVGDAKWIYDNCPVGTVVKVSSEDGEGPLGKPPRAVEKLEGSDNEGWDPTDPREDNPWRQALGEAFGRTAYGPEGNMDAAAPAGGYAERAAASDDGAGGQNAPGSALLFPDVKPGDWFYDSVMWCAERSVLRGTGAGFEPRGAVSRAMLWQMMHQLAGEPGSGDVDGQGETGAGESGVPDAAGLSPWYAAARSWCLENGIAAACGPSEAGEPAKRQELVEALYRYHRLFKDANPDVSADLSAYADAGELSPEAAEAFSWAVSAGIITGDTDGEGNMKLRPSDGLTRAELAAVMQRYGELR